MKYQTFSILLKEYYHIRRTHDMAIEGTKFRRNHKRIYQELFKIIVKEHFPLPSNDISIIFPKDVNRHKYIKLDLFYDTQTNTFIIKKVHIDNKEEIFSFGESHTIVIDKCMFDMQMEAFETRKRRVKYNRLLKRILKRRKKFLFRAHFYAYPSGELIDRSAILSAENIITENTRKKREERRAAQREKLRQEKEREYAARHAPPKIDYYLKIYSENQTYKIIKTKHLYHKRKGKARIEGFTDEMIKHLFLSALEDGEIKQYKRCVLIFPKDDQKSNYYSMLVDFNSQKNRFTIITLFVDDSRYRKIFHFPKEKHAVYLDNISFKQLKKI
jgi:hypothetical protein